MSINLWINVFYSQLEAIFSCKFLTLSWHSAGVSGALYFWREKKRSIRWADNLSHFWPQIQLQIQKNSKVDNLSHFLPDTNHKLQSQRSWGKAHKQSVRPDHPIIISTVFVFVFFVSVLVFVFGLFLSSSLSMSLLRQSRKRISQASRPPNNQPYSCKQRGHRLCLTEISWTDLWKSASTSNH